MNQWLLIWNYLKAKPLNTALNTFLLALGIAVMAILIISSRQLQDRIATNARGIDLVVGAKGSPMQLILCNIFHVDFPTGNISLPEAERVARHRLVKSAIPLALGDSYQGYRIIGTTHAYAELYQAELITGTLWREPMEVVIGSNVARQLNLKPGATFASNHGLARSGHAHDGHPFIVKGILQRANNVLDNLILTGVESIWQVHEDHGEGEENENRDPEPVKAGEIASPLVPSAAQGDSTKEITAMLIQFRSPMGVIQLPRWVNSQSRLQAASPAFETARLFSIMGVGVDILQAIAYVVIVISALSIFIALYNSLKERRYDLAIMRSMGAPRRRIVWSVIMEGVVLAAAGCVIGLLLAHGAVIVCSLVLMEARMAGISGFVFYFEEGIILASSLLLGVLCALVPAWQAYRTDISKVLATG